MFHSRSVFLIVYIAVFAGLVGSTAFGPYAYGQNARRSSAERELPRIDNVEGDRVVTVLPKDAIPAIDDPTFVTAAHASFMKPREPVIGIASASVAKAYSVWHLERHEIVNDQLGGQPVAVTW